MKDYDEASPDRSQTGRWEFTVWAAALIGTKKHEATGQNITPHKFKVYQELTVEGDR